MGAENQRNGEDSAIEMLKADHGRVRELFREYEDTADGGAKRGIADRIFTELEIHTRLEEEIFYPAVRADADESMQALVSEHFEDHQEVKDLIGELRDLDPEDEDYDVRFEELIDSVEQHIDEEESELLPGAAERLGDRLEEIGAEMRELKSQLTASVGRGNEPAGPPPPQGWIRPRRIA